MIGDLLMGVALASAGKKASAFDDLMEELAIPLGEALDPSAPPEQHASRLAALREMAGTMLGVAKRPDRMPFHWALEFPEVDGFDAVLSNPPFQGGQKITGVLGTDYRNYLVRHLANGKRGSADLCAYFFLRAARRLKDGGGLAMLATNTIAQGDTREVGLEQLIADGHTIPRAVASRKWPGSANLEVAHVWVRRGAWAGEHILDDAPATGITPFLTVPGAVSGTPYRLAANADKSFQGSIVLGMGFVLTPEEAQALISRNPKNRPVL